MRDPGLFFSGSAHLQLLDKILLNPSFIGLFPVFMVNIFYGIFLVKVFKIYYSSNIDINSGHQLQRIDFCGNRFKAVWVLQHDFILQSSDGRIL